VIVALRRRVVATPGLSAALALPARFIDNARDLPIRLVAGDPDAMT